MADADAHARFQYNGNSRSATVTKIDLPFFRVWKCWHCI